jgi:hypothetical protein
MTVEGVTHDKTKILAKEGEEIKDQLDVSVKRRIDETVDYHYMSDNADHSTERSPGDEVAMTNKLNEVWGLQANIHFTTGTVDQKQVQQDLGREIEAPTTAAPEWTAITAFGTGGDYNVFLVWAFSAAQEANAGTGGRGGETMLEDGACSDGLTLAHEAGHHLGLYNGTSHPSQGVMSPCGGSERRRVFKSEADTAKSLVNLTRMKRTDE